MIDYRLAGGTYFFTVTLTDRVDALRQSFREVKKSHPFEIGAIVIVPEHLHAVWTLPDGEHDFSLRWRQIKSAFSRQISKSRLRKHERGIWQRRFWEHAIRDDDDFRRHVDYIHFNPVKHGYVRNVADWRHSSFHRYVRLEILPENWAGFDEEFGIDLE